MRLVEDIMMGLQLQNDVAWKVEEAVVWCANLCSLMWSFHTQGKPTRHAHSTTSSHCGLYTTRFNALVHSSWCELHIACGRYLAFYGIRTMSVDKQTF